ncbi:hypothetical protein [Halostella pelagica]|uniref:hypothetical protein n=1 Tax=Halostella pelagica TaxID=2583824 RepID=UPI00108107B5|nr:hypothetical protein [Halostella pelagica]
MSGVTKFSDTEWASILAVAVILTVFDWFSASLDPVSRAVTAVLSGVAAFLAGTATTWAIRYR